ncbi:replication-associated recombination protein A [Candidatus Dojkabacteria bacterium]|nr:replication-associated recombination protein A [Candidatus Dojkabacteria bacterium]
MPLASQLRPKTLEEFIGQEHLTGEDGSLRILIDSGKIPSMIFWGPPASGKTTLAEIISKTVFSDFIRISAVIDGKDTLKKVITTAKANKDYRRLTILFVDEIHRWNKAQQDALLPFVESGEIILIGATTENPSFTVISPLLSRTRVFVFNSHSPENIIIALERGLKTLKRKMKKTTLAYLADLSNGDMRFALNSLEISANLTKEKEINKEVIEKSIQRFLRYDKKGDEHFNIISAIHKSLRSSNATAGVYWIVRMLEAGEDPLYIARRLLRFASEDIGNANPNALLLANVVFDTCQKLGIPECNTALVQLAEYLAKSPKNNISYIAAEKAKQDVLKYGNLPVPMHIRNAPTKLMKDMGYGKGYEYDHNLPSKKSDQRCMPEKLEKRDYFEIGK